jgi:hypothetical protein
VNREEIVAHLVKLRDARLRVEVDQLRSKWTSLRQIQQIHANASTVARAATALSLSDLAPLGEIRLGSIKRHNRVASEVLRQSDLVMKAQSLAKRARTTHAAIVQKRLSSQEALRERETEEFLAWKRSKKG